MTERVQTVLFMRHGVARHNLRDPQTGQTVNHRDPGLLDPPLVSEGRYGAIEAGRTIRAWFDSSAGLPLSSVSSSVESSTRTSSSTDQGGGGINHHPQLIVTSPLTRCIQTAVLAFLPGDDYERPIPPMVCVEHVREAFGIYYPDRRREKSKLKTYWPQVHFMDSMTEHDEDWREDHRENFADIQVRIDRFLAWLVQRPESSVMVMSHGVWLETLLRLYDKAGTALPEGQRVYNCDVFACRILSRDEKFVCIEQSQKIAGSFHPPRPQHPL